MKSIAILGSTGSIGTQAVDVVQGLCDSIRVRALSARTNVDLLTRQARELDVDRVAIVDEEAASKAAAAFEDMGVVCHVGMSGLLELIGAGQYDLVINAIVGSAGLRPTISVLESGIALALANKESLVAAGNLVNEVSARRQAPIIPVDSEHSAIFQCLVGEETSRLRRVILTASGGPFRQLSAEELAGVTLSDALAHPTWNMGRKITVDSATLMNKGLEVIEAHHLFGVDFDSVEVVVHPQSVIHSMVEMVDGSVLAHLGVPDMRIPIQYAMTYPDRAPSPASFLSLAEYGSLTFEDVDNERFPCLSLAYRAGRRGMTYPAAMNAANEEAVRAFLEQRVKFTDIASIVGEVLERHEPLPGDSMEEIAAAESEARSLAAGTIRNLEEGR